MLQTSARQELQLIERESDVLFYEKQLYCNIIYFHRVSNDIDADNLSKPILDALNTIVYNDDVQILKRTAMKIDLNSNYSLSNENIPSVWYNKLLQFTNNQSLKHVLFVEVGIIGELRVTFGGGD
ncbi:RusA family crossover junction endodeoxyribonuclease [Paenibacillus sp. M2]|uniref:RusA family crossover junction endodeoxyribonuclease n=1 Tax=Paenibacillus sp. M2 TaxID=3341793 RepID=UPI003989D94A